MKNNQSSLNANSVICRHFRSFDYRTRVITLSVIISPIPNTTRCIVRVGYAVRLPISEYEPGRSEIISEGRAFKRPIDMFILRKELALNSLVQDLIADMWEQKLKKNMRKYIKGIRNSKVYSVPRSRPIRESEEPESVESLIKAS